MTSRLTPSHGGKASSTAVARGRPWFRRMFWRLSVRKLRSPLDVATCIVVLLTATGGCTASNDLVVRRVAEEKTPKVLIAPTGIGPPLGYFALVKLDNAYCALKFEETAWSKEPDPLYRHALFEWHYQGDGSGDFSRSTAQRGQGKATWKYVPFIGRLSFQTGNVGVDCGDIHISWGGGTGLSFREARKDQTTEEAIKRGIRIAPTNWTDIKDVNVFDKRLTWYAYDAKRKDQSVPVDSLY